MPRLTGIDAPPLTDEQAALRRTIAETRGGFLPKPYEIWTLRPDFARHAQEVGRYFNDRSSLPARLGELASLLVARQWRAGYVWKTHMPRAIETGVASHVIDALATDRRPDFAAEDEEVVYEVVRRLHEERCLDDALYEKALRLLGRDGVVDLIGLIGYFSMLAITVKAFEI